MGKTRKLTINRSNLWVILTVLTGTAGLWIVMHRWLESKTRLKTKASAEPQVMSKVEASASLKPATWQELEPADPTDPVAHQAQLFLEGADSWRLAGASRRGKLHAHHGTYREDAFAMDVVGPWHLVAVSDGAGSYRLSRVGSHLVVETAAAKMKEILEAKPELSPKRLQQALDEALKAAYAAIQQEAERRELTIKEFSATFLLLVHSVTNDGHIVGSIQVGDGLIAIKHQDGTIEPLAERDSGTYGGETFFLTSRPVDAWLGRATVHRLEQPPEFLVAMSDGVADDFIPYEKHLVGLFRSLTKVVTQAEGDGEEDVAQLLLQLIGYDKRGSFDDRTLVMLYSTTFSGGT